LSRKKSDLHRPRECNRQTPDWLTFGRVVDIAKLGTVAMAAAAEAVSKTR